MLSCLPMILPFFLYTSANKLNKDVSKVNDWTTQWKISSRSKQAQEIIFSRKRQNLNHDLIYFNHNLVQQVPSQKHLRMHLDTKLNFQEHLDNIMSKVDKSIGLLRKLQSVLPRPSLASHYRKNI